MVLFYPPRGRFSRAVSIENSSEWLLEALRAEQPSEVIVLITYKFRYSFLRPWFCLERNKNESSILISPSSCSRAAGAPWRCRASSARSLGRLEGSSCSRRGTVPGQWPGQCPEREKVTTTTATTKISLSQVTSTLIIFLFFCAH